MAVSFKGAHVPQDIMLPGVRWYVASPLSTRHSEALLLERGVHVDHSTVHRWIITDSPQLAAAFHRRKRAVWVSWRMDETYIKVKGQWDSLARAVERDRPDARWPVDGAAGRASGQTLPDHGDPPPWRAREEHHRRECGP